jgi:hypothetical protein
VPIGGLMTTLFATWRTLPALAAARAGAPLLLPHPVSVSTTAWLAAVVVVLAGAIVVSVRALPTSPADDRSQRGSTMPYCGYMIYEAERGKSPAEQRAAELLQAHGILARHAGQLHARLASDSPNPSSARSTGSATPSTTPTTRPARLRRARAS